MDLSWGVPRWNCSLQLVEAIPSWRVFVFGGTADVYGEAQQAYAWRLEKTGGGGCLERGHIKWNPFKRGIKQNRCMVILSDLPYHSVEVWVGDELRVYLGRMNMVRIHLIAN